MRLIPGAGKRGRYAVLTYCWGPRPDTISKTTAQNLSQRLQSIPFAGLNLLYQDVVHLCRTLDIPYLWIDALCIIQGCKDDWLAESGRMCDIYSNAFLTVSATDAASPDEPLYKTWAQKPPGHIESPEIVAMPFYRGGEVYLRPCRYVLGNEVIMALFLVADGVSRSAISHGGSSILQATASGSV